MTLMGEWREFSRGICSCDGSVLELVPRKFVTLLNSEQSSERVTLRGNSDVSWGRAWDYQSPRKHASWDCVPSKRGQFVTLT